MTDLRERGFVTADVVASGLPNEVLAGDVVSTPVAQPAVDGTDTTPRNRVADGMALGLVGFATIPGLDEAVRGAASAVATVEGGSVTGLPTWFATTLAIQGAAAAITTRYLHTDKGTKLVDWVRDKASPVGGLKIGLVSEAVILLTAGSAAATAARHQQDPTRTKRQNMRYALASSLFVSAATTANVSPIASAIDRIAEKTPVGWPLITAGAVAVGGLLALAGRRYSQLREHADAASAYAYRSYYDRATTGPQIEGMAAKEVITALKDRRTLTLLLAENGQRVPILTPLEHNAEYNMEYFRQKHTDTPVYHVSSILNQADPGEYFVKKLAKRLRRLEREGAMLVIDDRVGGVVDSMADLEALLDEAGVEYTKNEFVDSRNGAPASVVHYAGKLQLADTESKPQFNDVESAFEAMRQADPETYNYENGTMLISPKDMTPELLEAMWEMYSERFDDLMSENPCMQKQTKEDLFAMLKHDKTLLSIKFQDGKPICAAYFVRDVSTAYWLNAKYYQERFPGEEIWYFPAIVSRMGEVGARHSLAVVDLLVKAASSSGAEPILAFQCTNLSKDYVKGPVVENVVNMMGQYKLKMEQIAEYTYVAYQLGRKETE